MPEYGGSFSAGYNPNMVTRTSLAMPEIPPVEGVDLGGLLNAIARMRRTKASNQMQALRPVVQAPAQETSPIRQFHQALDYMNRMESPLDRYTQGNAPLGSNFRNFPAASALAFGKDIFPNGFDVYANIMKSAGGVDPGAEDLARLRRAQAAALGGGSK